MADLQNGTLVTLTDGEQAKIIKELGRGGQGIVYLVDYQHNQYALKWYIKEPNEQFYENLQSNTKSGAPTNAFLWPLKVTRREYGSFGYIMKLRPEGYYELGSDFLLAKVRFASISAMINAAIKIIEGFEVLHLHGYSYQDLNDGNFFVRPTDGDVLICDNDNVCATGENLGIGGKMRYMAPEVVDGAKPNTYSDRFSLSIVLFLLFFGNHPLEGKKIISCPCMTEELEKKVYGKESLFIYDANNKDNLPVRGVHPNVIARWPVFPESLRQAFIDSFNRTAIENPTKRYLDSKWKSIVCALRNELIVCTYCKQETFVNIQSPGVCIECGKSIHLPCYINTKYGKIAISPQKYIYLGESSQPVAIVRVKNADPSVWEMQNISEKSWTVETPSGKIKEVPKGEVMPAKAGLKVTFNQQEKGEICSD